MRVVAIVKKNMAGKLIDLILILFFIKNSTLKKAIVDDVYMNKKFSCEGVPKYSFSVKSQIQCVHLCLRKNCTLVNYNTDETTTENCEVFPDSDSCSAVVWQENWAAIIIQVFSINYGIKLHFIF